VSLERFAEKSAENLIIGIEQSKKILFHRFIYALGIRHVGEESAVNLANHLGNLKELKKVEIDELLRMKDTGDVVAKSIYNWFRSKKNLKLLDKLAKVGVKITSPPRQARGKQAKKLQAKTFVLTGELESLTRDEAKEKIRQLSGDISSSVSKNTDWVVVGEEPGSKYDKAKKLGIKIIKEKQFLRMIK
jgi:DNA ligase (NAD+)